MYWTCLYLACGGLAEFISALPVKVIPDWPEGFFYGFEDWAIGQDKIYHGQQQQMK
jgi:hypothetical protein